MIIVYPLIGADMNNRMNLRCVVLATGATCGKGVTYIQPWRGWMWKFSGLWCLVRFFHTEGTSGYSLWK